VFFKKDYLTEKALTPQTSCVDLKP